MASPEELEKEAEELEEEADVLEQQSRLIAAQGRMQKAKSLRDKAAFLRQQHAGQAPSEAVLVQRVLSQLRTYQFTTSRSDQDVGSYVAKAPSTRRNAPDFFASELPDVPAARQLDAFINALPEALRRGYDTTPLKGFTEKEDAAVLNPLLFRAIAAWLAHGSLDKDSGPGTEDIQDVFSRELPAYWAARSKREARASAKISQAAGDASAPVGGLAASGASAAPAVPAAVEPSEGPLLGFIPSGYLRDTHVKGLTNPAQQPDRLICAGRQVLWTNTVCSIEDKPSLVPPRELDTGRGQLKKAAKRVFTAQGMRAFMVSLLMSCRELEMWWFWRDDSAVSSGVLPLSLSTTSPGLQMLFRLLSADASQLGYFPPPMPPPFECAGTVFSGFQRLTAWSTDISDELAAWKIEAPELYNLQRRTGRQVFSAVAEREGFQSEEVVVKFHYGAAKEATVMRSLQDLHCIPRIVADGEGPEGWPPFLAISPKARHFSILEDSPRIILTGMRDLALGLRTIANDHGLLHGDITPGNVMLAGAAALPPQLILTDFHGAGPLGSRSLPTTELFSAVGLSQKELPSLMTDLESTLYTFMHIATSEGLPWRHAISDMHAIKFLVMSLNFDDLLAVCPMELQPAFRELRQLFWPDDRYRPVPSEAAASEAANRFAEICEGYLGALKPKRGRPKGSPTKKAPRAAAGPSMTCFPGSSCTRAPIQPLKLRPRRAQKHMSHASLCCRMVVHSANVAAQLSHV